MDDLNSKDGFFPYLIFLPNRYFDTKKWYNRFFNKIHGNVIKELNYIGVSAKRIKDLEDMQLLMFDNELEPKLNVTYIHLFNGEYFSEHKYSKKKLQKERELLFLLAAKLGVSSIEYNTDITETTLEKVNSSVNVKQIDASVTYSKTMTTSKGQVGKEIYLNRGAPVYCLSKNIDQVEENIRVKFQKLNKKMFSYDFYQKNDCLKCFVYKRFSFKMLSLEYTSESEDILDKSFEIKTILFNYGLGFKLNKNVCVTEKIVYKLQFFTDLELRLKLSEIIRIKNDPFAIVREIYDSEEDKDIAVYNIAEYVRRYAKQLQLQYLEHIDYEDNDDNKSKSNNNDNNKSYPDDSDADSDNSNDSHIIITNNYHHRLLKWISGQEAGTFEKICKTFISTYQIKTWLYSTLKHEKDLDPVDTDSDNWGLIQLKEKKYNKYQNNAIKDRLKDCNDEICHGDSVNSYYDRAVRKSSIKINSIECENDSDDDWMQQHIQSKHDRCDYIDNQEIEDEDKEEWADEY